MPNAPQIGLYNWFLALLLCNVQTYSHASLINLETGIMLKINDESDPKGERIRCANPTSALSLTPTPCPGERWTAPL